MARRGLFGRSPRPAASLTNTIIAIAREMQQREDQNIVDAWQKGGLYQGKKVTDQMILDHWKQRASNVDKNDPLYDMYNNAHMEYDYSIHESKITTAYAQGKIGEGAAAAFYLGWSKKVPKNSEFWRVLQRDAAQFTRAAKSKSDALAKQQAELRYQNNLKSIYNKQIAGGEYLQDVLTNLARRGIRPAGGNPLVDPMTGSIYQMDAGDVQDMLGMVNRLTDAHFAQSEGANGPGTTPNFTQDGTTATSRVLYHDPVTGAAVTGADVLKKLQSFGYEGKSLTLDSLYTMINDQKAGLAASERLATHTGHLTDARQFRTQQETLAEVGREIKAWPVEQSYLDYRQKMVEAIHAPGASAQDITDAKNLYISQLTKLTKDPAVAGNDVFLNKLNGEINGDESVTTLAEDFTGLNNVQPQDIAKQNKIFDRAEEGQKAVESGNAVWVTGEWDNSTNTFKPAPGGSAVGPATQYDIQNNSGGIPTATVYLPDKNGRYVPTVIMGQPVVIHAFGPDGKEVPAAQGTNATVARIYDFPDGTKQVNYKDGKGNDLWSDIADSPWGSSAKLTDNGNAGYSLTIQAPTSQDAMANSGFSLVNGTNGAKVMVYNPQDAMLSTDPTHKSAIQNGGDPTTDFRSPNISYYKNQPDGVRNLYQLGQSEDFKQQVQTDTYLAAGFTPGADPKTGAITWTGGNQSVFDRGIQQSTGATVPGAAGVSPDRSTPASQLAPDQRYEPGFGTPSIDSFQNPYLPGTEMNTLWGQGYRPGTATPLATSQAYQNGNSAIGQPFQSGTLSFAPSGTDTSSLAGIKLASAGIKVPNVPTISVAGFTIPGTGTAAPSGANFGGQSVAPTASQSQPRPDGNNPYAPRAS